MKNFNKILILMVGMLVLAASCTKEPEVDQTPIAKVNDYVITGESIRRDLISFADRKDSPVLSYEDKKEFIDHQIRKELLIQEAVKRDLDKQEKFRQTIEIYWEQTLIATLLKEKSAELVKNTIITSEEIEARYKDMAQSRPRMPSLAEMTPELEREIRKEKETEAMGNWIENIRKNAKITMYEDNLRDLR